MLNWFRRRTADDIVADQAFEAERLAVEHEAAAEHHEALAHMYRARLKRLRPVQASAKRPAAKARLSVARLLPKTTGQDLAA